MSSHDISELKRLCTKLIVLQNGSVIFSDSPQAVQNEYCHCTICVDDSGKTLEILEKTDCSYTRKAEVFSIATQDIAKMINLLYNLTKQVEIRNFTCEHPAFSDGLLAMLKKAVI